MATDKVSKRARKSAKELGAPGLVEALTFVNMAQVKDGQPWQMHCHIANGLITAGNGVMMAGAKVEEDLNACPQTGVFLDALKKCGQGLSIVQLDAVSLAVRAGRLKATVPCLAPGSLHPGEPDPACAVIDDRLKAGFTLLAPMLEDTAPRPLEASVLLQGNTMVATDGKMMIETWHGIDLPPGLMIPRASIVAISKVTKKLTRFGFSRNSATFYFEDDSFIKTQLFEGGYPDYAALFNPNAQPWPLPEGFFDGVKALESLSRDANKALRFTDQGMHVVGMDGKEAGSYEIEGLEAGIAFNIEFLKIAQPVFHKADFSARDRVYFFNDAGTARGVIMGMRF